MTHSPETIPAPIGAPIGAPIRYTNPRSVFPAPIGAVLRLSVLGKPLTDTVTGYAIKTFGDDEYWTNVPCYVLATYGAWPVRDCEVVR